VNEASTLIQSAAHEDANIIFGAVLDEQMGEEVKITVIATGFRDQMPERRARMLTVEETPVVSVPVVAPDAWLREPAAGNKPEVAAPPARFLSEDEEESKGEKDAAPFFFASSRPVVATTMTLAEPEDLRAPGMEKKAAPEEMAEAQTPGPTFEERAVEPGPAGMSFDEEFRALTASLADEPMHSEPSLFSEGEEEAQRELDVPAFMRRMRI
jgi:cell division protein FtsZ